MQEIISAFVAYVNQPDVMFSLMAGIGAIFHFYKAKYRKQLTDTFVEYWFMKETGHSLGTVGMLIGAISAAIASGTLTGASDAAIISSGFLLGYSMDSSLNKGTHPSEVLKSVSN